MKKNTNLFIKYVVLSLVIMSGILLYGYNVRFNEYVIKELPIEDFRNKLISYVETWESKYHANVNYTFVYDDFYSANLVISQSRYPDKKFFENDILDVNISRGPDPDKEIYLPDFTGYTIDKIFSFIESEKLVNYEILYEYSTEFPRSVYMSSTIDTPTMKRSDPIEFTVSKGEKGTFEVIVPDFKEYKKKKIDSWAKLNDITIDYDFVFSKKFEKDTVIEQEPKPKTIISSGDTIKIKMSYGEPVKMMDLINKTEKEALLELEKNGLQAKVDYYYSDTVKENTVTGQSIDKNTNVPKDSEVNLTVSLGGIPAVNFQGKSLDEMKKWIADINSKGGNLKTEVTRVMSDYDEGIIVKHNYKSGKLSVNTIFKIDVSEGKQVMVPDLNKKNYDEVLLLAGDNFNLEVVKRYNKSLSLKDLVFSQNLTPSKWVKKGSKLIVHISKGNRLQLGEYKNWTDLQKYIEGENLIGANITYNVTYQYSETQEGGTILSISEKEPTVGTTLELVVSEGVGVMVPDLVGLSREEASKLIVNKLKENYIGEYNDITKDAVLSQSLTPNEIVPHNSEIDIVYSMGNELNIEGITKITDLIAIVDEANSKKANIVLNIEEIDTSKEAGTIESINGVLMKQLKANQTYTVLVSKGQ